MNANYTPLCAKIYVYHYTSTTTCIMLGYDIINAHLRLCYMQLNFPWKKLQKKNF